MEWTATIDALEQRQAERGDSAAPPRGRDGETESVGARQRGEILNVAAELFARYGYSKTTIGDIARDCAMSPANLYRYYRNKQAIGCAVVARFLEQEVAVIRGAQDGAGPRVEDRLRAGIVAEVGHTVAALAEAPKIVELAEMICEAEEGRVVITRHIAEREAWMTRLIAEGVAAGEFAVPDPARAARGMLMGLKVFYAPFALARHGLDSVEPDLAATLDLLCAGLRAR